MRASRILAAAALAALTSTGCSSAGDGRVSAPSSTAAVPAPAASVLAGYGLDGMDTVEVIDHLDRLGGTDRPQDLTASVRPDELQLSAGGRKSTLPIPRDRFYLSVAPYVKSTHECFYHSLTTCAGELKDTKVRVRITDDTHGKVLLDATRTTFANGFVGFWLPRDIRGTLRISRDGRSAQTSIATDRDAPTCLTTLKLV
jgi:hypothetical protein